MENMFNFYIVLTLKKKKEKEPRERVNSFEYDVTNVLNNFWEDGTVMHLNQN